MPFWRGEGQVPTAGARARAGRVRGASWAYQKERAAVRWLTRAVPIEARAARNLWRYVTDQRAATGTLPTDSRGSRSSGFATSWANYRVCILSPFGARVQRALGAGAGGAPGHDGGRRGAELVERRRHSCCALPAPTIRPSWRRLLPEPEDIEDVVIEQLTKSALFASHFRENAARALLAAAAPAQRALAACGASA